MNINELEGVRVGHVTDGDALTGCTAVVFPGGAVAGHVAWGIATGTRELAAAEPRHLVDRIHGICFSGGSAFGLAAASGVARRLELEGIGHRTTCGPVPIVPGAVVYDLNLGSSAVRPDEDMGARAADRALRRLDAPCPSGCVGAGAGVSSGKLLGIECATKTGLGNGGIRTTDGLQIAALAVVNPVGDVMNPATGEIIAGTRVAPDSMELVGTSSIIRGGARCQAVQNNTTLCVVATNRRLSRQEACWVSEQALMALARIIDPPFTRHDGDVVFCVSVGDHDCDLHRVGVLARDAVGTAIIDACYHATPAGGLPVTGDLRQPDLIGVRGFWGEKVRGVERPSADLAKKKKTAKKKTAKKKTAKKKTAKKKTAKKKTAKKKTAKKKTAKKKTAKN